jgi:hypothetical protein
LVQPASVRAVHTTATPAKRTGRSKRDAAIGTTPSRSEVAPSPAT